MILSWSEAERWAGGMLARRRRERVFFVLGDVGVGAFVEITTNRDKRRGERRGGGMGRLGVIIWCSWHVLCWRGCPKEKAKLVLLQTREPRQSCGNAGMEEGFTTNGDRVKRGCCNWWSQWLCVCVCVWVSWGGERKWRHFLLDLIHSPPLCSCSHHDGSHTTGQKKENSLSGVTDDCLRQRKSLGLPCLNVAPRVIAGFATSIARVSSYL